MAVSLTDIIKECQKLFPPGYVDPYFDETCRYLAVRAVREIYGRRNWNFMRVTGNFTTEVNQRSFTTIGIELGNSIKDWGKLYIEGYPPLDAVPYDRFVNDYIWQTLTGQPLRYTSQRIDGTPTILLDPIPNEVYTVNYSYFNIPQTVMGGDGEAKEYTFEHFPGSEMSVIVDMILSDYFANDSRYSKRYFDIGQGSFNSMVENDKKISSDHKSELRRDPRPGQFRRRCFDRAVRRY